MDGELQQQTLVQLTLSRSNLEALIAKLNGNPPGSECTIMKQIGPDTLWIVEAVEDKAHYTDRQRGIMHGDTERAMREARNG